MAGGRASRLCTLKKLLYWGEMGEQGRADRTGLLSIGQLLFLRVDRKMTDNHLFRLEKGPMGLRECSTQAEDPDSFPAPS